MDVLFAVMPFGGMRHPALGATLLRSALQESGIPAGIAYFTLDFARTLGREAYEGIVLSAPQHLAGEWVFARAAFGQASTLEQLRETAGARDEELWEYVRAGREAAEPFLDECLAAVLAANPRIVGFTSTFQQHVASIALARRIKSVRPDILTIIGGANCEGPMGRELLRQCGCFDAVASGEADGAIVEIVRHALRYGVFPDSAAGIFTRRNVDDPDHPAVNPTEDLNRLPYVEFRDFIQQFQAHFDGQALTPRLMFETSRGCWWGQKHHCTFCGLNGGTMAFRSKGAVRALDELDRLAALHPGLEIDVVDNILDMRYFRDFLPELAKRETKHHLFYETKANLRKDQVRMLRDAGVTMIQPGIESLSSNVLQIMRKGISMLQNVQLLKWCKELGVQAYWNVLWGFPGEDPRDYAGMAKLIPKLTHLRPPVSSAGIRLDRFSPNFEEAQARGFADVRPFPAYAHVYPFDSKALENIAYFFTFRHADGRTDFSYFDECREGIAAWRNGCEDDELFSLVQGDVLVIWDQRAARTEPALTAIKGLNKRIYEICDGVRTLHEIASDEIVRSFDAGETRIKEVLDDFEARDLLISEGSKFLSLAVPVGDYVPHKAGVTRFMAALRARKSALTHPPLPELAKA